MKFLTGIILLCFAAATYAAPRIVGGQDAPDGKYPYQVSLRAPNSHFCGGSILNKRWILTAAHCLKGQSVNRIKVAAGSSLLNGTDRATYNAEHITWHEKYNGNLFINDVGLIRVDRDIEFNDKVQPIDLPVEDSTKENYPVVLTGWGRLQVGGPIPNNLQEIVLKVIGQRKCQKKIWSVKITDSHICTLTRSGEGACNGDSGGPLVSDGVQIGIVSFGSPCALGSPDVFTRVYTFLDWINEKMAQY